jgi:transposase
MAFIRKVKTANGAIAIQIAHKAYGKIIRIEHIGSAHNDTDLQLLVALAEKCLKAGQQSLLEPQATQTVQIRQSVSSVLLDVLTNQYDRLGFDALDDEDFKYLCIARLVEPTSKLDSLRVLEELGITGVVGEDQLYRCMKRVITGNYRDRLAKLCFAHASQDKGISLVLYDVTTLYFEIQKEDAYRIPGMSKERRLEPQIIVGLLVDQNGFPLELHSFEGNKAETKTIVPVVEEFRRRHGLIGITVVADAGMLSQDNLHALNEAGYTYIVGSRMHKIPYDIAEYQKTKQALANGQIITSKTAIEDQRIIYQYRAKRAALDLHNIEKQVEKAEKIISGKVTAKRAKFLNVKAKGKQTKALNQVLIDKAKALAGIKGYVTNLPKREASDRQVIAYYHQLWHVEQSFRMSKHDLRARPIFHRKQEAIDAHLTVVMAALAIGRTIERKTDLSIKRLVQTLRPIRSGTVVIAGKEYVAEAEITASAVPLLKKLGRAH